MSSQYISYKPGGGSGGGGGVTIGQPVTGGTPLDILYVDADGNIGQDDNLNFDSGLSLFRAPNINTGDIQGSTFEFDGFCQVNDLSVNGGLTVNSTADFNALVNIQTLVVAADIQVTSPGDSVPLTIFAAPGTGSQTANLTEWYDSDVALQTWVDPDGFFNTNRFAADTIEGGSLIKSFGDLQVDGETDVDSLFCNSFNSGAAQFNAQVDMRDLLLVNQIGLNDGSGGSPWVYLTGNSSGTGYGIAFPAAQGGSGTTLRNDGSGNLTWVTSSAPTPGTANQLYGTNAAATGFESKAVTATAAGALSVASTLTVVGTTTLATSLTGVVKASSGVVSASTVVNADVSSSAAIAYSKLASISTGQVLLGNAGVPTATTLSGDITVGATGVTAIGSGKVTNAMLAGSIDLTSKVTGLLPVANGGTNSSATPTAGGAGYGTGTAHAYTAAGTSGQVLVSAGASAPGWGTDVLGVATNTAASAGYKGEYVESVAGPINFTATGGFKDLTSISLTAGDWDVTLVAQSNNNAAVAVTSYQFGISTTTGNSSTGLVFGSNYIQLPGSSSTQDVSGSIASYRMSLSTTTTVYGKMLCTWSTGTPQAYGRLSARRIR